MRLTHVPLISCLLVTVHQALSGQAVSSERALRRRALIAFAAAPLPSTTGMRVTFVASDGIGAALGLRMNDTLLAMNGTSLVSAAVFGKAVRALRAGDRVTADVRRNGSIARLSAVAPPYPLERAPGLTVHYSSATSSYDDRVRTLVSRPSDARGRLPAVFIVPWLSCSSVELSIPGVLPGIRAMVHGLTLAGYEVWRVDRPGQGDSYGPDCSELDYEREIAAFRAAYAAMRHSAEVDTSQVFLFGMSLGGAIAAQLAGEHPPRGVISQGGFARTWYERILEFDRRRLQLAGRTAAETEERMRALSELYAGFLLESQAPGDVIRKKPHLAFAWEDEPAHQYGRPATFFHGVQRANFGAAWSRVRVPTLVLWGDNDFIMAREDQELIVRIVNANGAGLAQLVTIPGMDHSMMRFPSLQQAFSGSGGEVTSDPLDAVIRWLRTVSAR